MIMRAECQNAMRAERDVVVMARIGTWVLPFSAAIVVNTFAPSGWVFAAAGAVVAAGTVVVNRFARQVGDVVW
jgi:hypothetical protein